MQTDDCGSGSQLCAVTNGVNKKIPYRSADLRLRTVALTLSLSSCTAGAELSALHGVLRQQAQRQEADLAVSPVQRRAGHQLLQEQVRVQSVSAQVGGAVAPQLWRSGESVKFHESAVKVASNIFEILARRVCCSKCIFVSYRVSISHWSE